MKISSPLLVLIAVAAVAAPWWIHANARATWHAKEEASRHQADRVTQLQAENDQLSKRLAQSGPPQRALTEEELRELLRLRNEVRDLREQSGRLGKLREENQRLERGITNAAAARIETSPAELDAEIAVEMMDAMKNIAAELPSVLQRYATEHAYRSPNDFSELRNYFSKVNGRRMPGLYSCDFVRDSGPLPGDSLILRERGTRRTPEGTFARLYLFNDGRVVEARQDNDNFDGWEDQHMHDTAGSR